MLTGRFILGAAAAGVAMAGTPLFAQGSLPDQLAVCARIGKKDARLECYDSIARAASQGTYTSSFGSSSIRTPQGAPPPPPPGAPAVGAGFGAEQIARPPAGRDESEGQNEISAAVASARDNGVGMWQIALADGAIWRMTERVGNFRPPAPQETVTIRKGALGSYLMQVGKQAAVRVERVR
ncbi:hypothetical protein [Sphingobium nicotianae]|uniref:Uncharacterized protein n=1 Tax=Sphingobium nicotianae TaxID=2782607 RepID=A0A9X1IQI3_9SPHN|nr:hypothetical protein [Sphingobium nicotianae]MBT2186646.1 hypothetical protein [Sphingobium nicotianae]